MPSVRGFLESSKSRVRVVAGARGFSSFFKVCLWAALNSIPRSVVGALPPPLQRAVNACRDRVVRGAVIESCGSLFSLVDSESAAIVMPDFEPWMWRYLRLKEGDVFVDVGAHVGKYTVTAAKIVGPRGLVVAIEPHPENYKALVRSVRLNGLRNVVALNIAAWDRDCELELFFAESSGRHTVKEGGGRGSVKVRARALDDVLEEVEVPRVDVVKVDVEGAEVEVLRGLSRTIRKFRPLVVFESFKEGSAERVAGELGCDVELIPETSSSWPKYYLLRAR